MGKSLGNTLEPNDLVHKFGTDAVRYFFLKEVEFGSDGDYSEDRFINIVNAHLANTIGISTLASYNQSLWIIGVAAFIFFWICEADGFIHIYDLNYSLQEIFLTVLLDF